MMDDVLYKIMEAIGEGGVVKRIAGLFRRRSAPEVAVSMKEVVEITKLDPVVFRRNYDAGAELKAQELNPGALEKGEELHRLVELNEEVVAFTGTGDQAMEVIRQFQAHPAIKANRDEVKRDGVSLKRTGIQVIAQPYNEGDDHYMYPPNSKGALERQEIVGIEKEDDGKYAVYVMLPPMWATEGHPQIPELSGYLGKADYGRLVTEHTEYLFSQKLPEMTDMERFLENPVWRYLKSQRTAIEQAMVRGALIRYSKSNGYERFESLSVQERKPFPEQRINNPPPVRHMTEDELRGYLSRVVVPEEAASNLPK